MQQLTPWDDMSHYFLLLLSFMPRASCVFGRISGTNGVQIIDLDRYARFVYLVNVQHLDRSYSQTELKYIKRTYIEK